MYTNTPSEIVARHHKDTPIPTETSPYTTQDLPMPRNILPHDNIHTDIQAHVSDFQRSVVDEVRHAVETHAVVVVGMAQNPFCKKARKALEKAGKPFTYLEYGSYFSQWRVRLAIKMWSGWETFPMVFVNGTLIGGFDELAKQLETGKFGA